MMLVVKLIGISTDDIISQTRDIDTNDTISWHKYT